MSDYQVESLSGLCAFEQNLLKSFDYQGFKGMRVALGVSGGADSMALAGAVCAIAGRRQIEVVLVYVCHGQWTSFRKSALQLIEQHFSDQVIVHNDPSGQLSLKSESQMRHYRRQFLSQISSELNCHFKMLAHHAEDLLETRLMRMIRGTGPQGLESMLEWDPLQQIFRPFLHLDRQTILDYLKDRQIPHLEDPTNEDQDFLRNFLRRNWLQQIESVHPGAKKNLAQSLERIASKLKDSESTVEPTLSRSLFNRMPESDQKHLLARYLRFHQVPEYTQAHIAEILKRLKTKQKIFDFTVAGRHWRVSPTRFGLDSKLEIRP